MSILQKIDTWHRTTVGLVTFGILEFALGYLFLSLAIDSGSLLDYAIAILLIAFGIVDAAQLFKKRKNE